MDSEGGRMRFRRGAWARLQDARTMSCRAFIQRKATNHRRRLMGKKMTPKEKVLMRRGYILKIKQLGVSLVAQWLRICLRMQETRV